VRGEMFVEKLKCARCGEEHDPDEKVFYCSKLDGRLDIYYDYDAISSVLTKDELVRRKGGTWKYRELLPIKEGTRVVDLGEGNTPLIKCEDLGRAIGLRNLYAKDETRNPTWSFKDRPMSVGVAKGIEFGVKTAVIASSGNAAAALAAFCAKANIDCVTFVPHFAGAGKVAQLMLYGAKVVRLRWGEEEDPTVKMMLETSRKYGWYPCPSFGPFNPYQFEGNKTMAYEVCEQLNWEAPDWLFIPVGSGGLLAGNWKGFKEFKNLGFMSSLPKIVAVQSTGCAPLVRAHEQGKGPFEIEPWGKPETIATGLEDPFPWDGDAALRAIRESEGTAVSVTNEEILEAQKMLAKEEGIFAEPSGVASLAGLIKLLKRGVVDSGDLVVVEITGSGLKDPEVVSEHMGLPPVIEPKIEVVDSYLRELGA